MTLLYVGVAASATAFMMSLLAVFAIYGYVRLLDETAAQTAVHAYSFGMLEQRLRQPFNIAAVAFEKEAAHSGIVTVGTQHQLGPPGSVAFPGARPAQVVIGGRVRTGDALERTNPAGFFIAELLGAHPRRVAFDGGWMLVALDTSSVLTVVLLGFGVIVLAGALAAFAAWIAGRYIAAEALRPLVEVTQALQRFAARDFTPEPVAVAGRSEFDAVAEAYNAAAVQVDAAFLEHERADERIRQFVADAGHELRTPLTIVLGFTEHVRRVSEPGDASLTFAFESIDAEGRRMRALIDNLVLLARLDSEERGFVEPFALGDLLEELVAARRPLHPGTDIRLEANEDAAIFADRDDVREAVGNVLDNALKYGARRPVRVAAERLDETRVKVIVEDEGPGVGPAEREAIFERFYRGSGSRDVDGSGLGLAIARRALQRAGGNLYLVEQAPETRGAAFAFELPAGASPAPVAAARKT
jgi:two-component system OmpR family sensor kinase